MLGRSAALRSTGWARSNRVGASVDASGSPIPWFTYSSLGFLEPRLARIDLSPRVFEWGAGASTTWWCERASDVTAIEHDEHWCRQTADTLPPNGAVHLRKVDGPAASYPAAIGEFDGTFDIAIIDGRLRNECAAAVVALDRAPGVVIWDNAERPHYTPGQQALLDHGYKVIPFHGLGPISPVPWTTSVYYRPDANCLEI